MRRKSDGQVRVPETPDNNEKDRVKEAKTTPRRRQASLFLRKKASFYSGPGSRNAQKAEESMNASLILGNVSLNNSLMANFNSSLMVNVNDSGRRDSCDSDLNRSAILFPHLVRGG